VADHRTSAQVLLAATNIPPGTKVDVIAIPKHAASTTVLSSALAGSTGAATASATVPLTPGETIIQASVTVDIAIAEAGGAAFHLGAVGGERVASLKVGATAGGGSSLVYVTESGREIPASRE
jgi:hypothetical protein